MYMLEIAVRYVGEKIVILIKHSVKKAFGQFHSFS